MASRHILKIIKQAKQGDPEAQLLLGRCYISGGEGLAANLPTAYRWLAAAADQGSSQAAWLIAEQIPPTAVDSPMRAKTYYQTADRQGSLVAAQVLAEWQLSGALGPRTEAEKHVARNALREAAQSGLLQAQLAIGLQAARGESFSTDLAWLEQAAERGSQEAILALVDYYWEGSGLHLNPLGKTESPLDNARLDAAQKCLAWHTRAYGSAEKRMSVAEAWRRGCLLLVNRQQQAAKWLTKAATGNDSRAAYLLGLLYMGPSHVRGI